MIILQPTILMILIGNMFSILSSIFFFLSTRSKTLGNSMKMQIIDCSACIISGFMFMSISAVLVNSGSLIRSIFVKKDMSKKSILIIGLLTSVIALLFNTRGFIGILPCIATFQFSLALSKKENLPMKKYIYNISVNCFIWMVYEILIYDICGFLFSTCSCISAYLSANKIYTDKSKV